MKIFLGVSFPFSITAEVVKNSFQPSILGTGKNPIVYLTQLLGLCCHSSGRFM